MRVGAGKTFGDDPPPWERKAPRPCARNPLASVEPPDGAVGPEFPRLYPSANILVATKRTLRHETARSSAPRIATGDYDAVIIGHSQFERIPVSRERQERLLQEQIWEIEDGIAEPQGQPRRALYHQGAERTKKNLETS